MRSLGLARTAGVALLTYAANALFRLGRWEDAEEAVAEAWALRPTGAAALEVRLARCRIDLGRGRLDDAAADLEAVELLARSTAGPRHRIPLLVLFAALELWRRRPEHALRHVEDGLTVAEAGADDIWSIAPLVWHGTWAWADLVAARTPPSQAQADRLRQHCAELDRRGPSTVPAVRRRSRRSASCAPPRWPGPSRPPIPTRGNAPSTPWTSTSTPTRPPTPGCGRPRRCSSAARAAPTRRTCCGTPRTSPAHLGARPLLEDIAALAGRARITLDIPAQPPPPATAPGVLDGLTARELEVLHELANGLTNREIGERLFISEKTVGVHVARIFAKIGVHSRVQASAVLHRLSGTP